MSTIMDYLDGQFQDEKQEEIGIGGFTALVRLREKYTRSSSVPTTFLENGDHINDHIIRNPLTLLIEGNVSDLFVKPSPFKEQIREVQDEIGTITSYVPDRTSAQVSVVSGLVADVGNAIDKIDAIIDAGKQLTNNFGVIEENVANIERFVDDMEAHYYSDYLIAIDMPYRRYDSMRITNLEVERDNQFNALNFRLEAQQVRFADTIYVNVNIAPNPSIGTDGQTENLEDKGAQEGTQPPTTFFTDVIEVAGNIFS